jgi:type II secretory pathway predicted ATPase ExeA
VSSASQRLSVGADPDTYVPRLALESALAELAEVTDKEPSCAALSGGAGLGKTLLLQVLRRRLAGAYECLYLPSPRLGAEEIWGWAAQALGLGTGEDDRGAVLGRASRLPDEGSGLVLLVDDAGLLPPATRADLLAALDTRGFTLVLAFDAEDRVQLESLPAFVQRIDLGPPMTLSETRAYVHGRLRAFDPAGELGARLNAERLAGFHEAAAGVPARLNALLDAWLEESQGLPGRPRPVGSRPLVAAAAARTAPARAPRPELPEELAPWAARLRQPHVQLGLITLFVAAILGSWWFAWRLSPGVSSVGVPLEELTPAPATEEALPPVAAPAPEVEETLTRAPVLPPVVDEETLPLEVEPAVREAGAAERTEVAPAPVPAPNDATPENAPRERGAVTLPPAAKAKPASRRPTRSLAPPVPAVPPIRDEAEVEAPVVVASHAFPDEHVPQPLVEKPLAAPPAGPRLSVNAKPWASIQLDGKDVGETPLGELRLTPGSHVVTATLPDGRVIERRVEAKAGDLYVVFP